MGILLAVERNKNNVNGGGGSLPLKVKLKRIVLVSLN
jgi:hypothetical protein